MRSPAADKARKKQDLCLRSLSTVPVRSQSLRSPYIIRIAFFLAACSKDELAAVQHQNVLFFCQQDGIYHRHAAQFPHSHNAAVNGLRTLAENCNSRQKFFQFHKIRFYFFHCGSSVKAFYGSLKFSTDIFVGFSNFAYKIFRKGTFYTAVNGSLKRIGNPGHRRNYYAYSVGLCPVHDNLNRI